jgi:hypothetical protein
MNNCYVITSVIDIDNSCLLKEDQIRTILSTQERLDDTIKTIESIFNQDSNATIFLVDGSKNYFNVLIEKFPKLQYVQLETINASVGNIVRTHKSKSYGENIMLLEFLKHYKKKIVDNYDFLVKVSGRYYFTTHFIDDLIAANVNKFLFKKPVFWNRQNLTYIPEYFLPTDMYVDDNLGGYYTVAYAVGAMQMNKYEIILNACCTMVDENSKYFYVDIEYIFYKIFNELELNNTIHLVDWIIEGRGGQNGKYFRY